MAVPSQTDKLPKKVIFSALLGNFIEWYDLAIFAYAAVAIGQTFFSGAPESVQLIAAFAAFGLTYLVRPISGLVLGVLGDRIGRKNLLVFTILIMGASTTAIGVLPGYAYWGIAAPLLLLLFRVLQGVGAGGEFMGAATFVAEHSPQKRRGLAMALIQLGTGLCYPVAFLIAYGLIQFGGVEWYNSVGWRVLFLVSAPLTLIALYIRKNLEESPVFAEMKKSQALASAPIREIFRTQRNVVLAGFLFMLCFVTNGVLFLFYLPTRISGRPELGGAGVVVVVGLLVFALSIPAWGYLVDQITRHTGRLILTVSCVVLPVPCMIAIESESLAAVAVGYLVYGVVAGLCYAVIYVTLVEIVPARVRFTGTALIDNLAKALGASTTILISLALISLTGSNIAPAWYVALMSVPSVFAVFWLRRIDRRRAAEARAEAVDDVTPPTLPAASPAPASLAD